MDFTSYENKIPQIFLTGLISAFKKVLGYVCKWYSINLKISNLIRISVCDLSNRALGTWVYFKEFSGWYSGDVDVTL